MTVLKNRLNCRTEGVFFTSLCNYHMSDFLYDIITIPVVNDSPNNLQLSAFRNVVKLTDGGNSNIYTAFFSDVIANVVIKIIREEKMYDVRVINEFELEYQLLLRLDHPNIIKTYGRGVTANGRRFIVLEHLVGGTMQKVLERNWMSAEVSLDDNHDSLIRKYYNRVFN